MRRSTRSVRGGVILFAALLLALVGCSAGGGATGTAAPGSPSSAETADGGPLGFSGDTLDGAPLDAAALAGGPVVMWFWAPF